jgi:hypothetical protein
MGGTAGMAVSIASAQFEDPGWGSETAQVEPCAIRGQNCCAAEHAWVRSAVNYKVGIFVRVPERFGFPRDEEFGVALARSALD